LEDISRFAVGWMIAYRESAELALTSTSGTEQPCPAMTIDNPAAD